MMEKGSNDSETDSLGLLLSLFYFAFPTFSLSLSLFPLLQVKYLQIMNQSAEKGQNPARWIRYMTEASSYICRM